MRRSTIAAAVTLATLTLAGCGSSDTPSSSSPSPTPAATSARQAALIQPVPDTHKNKYVVGPFTVTLVQGIAQQPSGKTGSELLVENTSNDFTGYCNPEIQYTQGNEVVATSNPSTGSLAPGQKQTVWVDIVPDRDVSGQYVDAQLVSVWFGTDRGEPGTRLQLAH
ncbi:hypothetical protein B7C42_01666 [Nocardia cerradoensis]|uniref:Lipoprotein n=2 Tax=Nocardia cerradoensis TaxID=85688 RepID=A0A231HCQ1_9NOCA|nr:hypothetical protein B7C42_01666 [Nocardia cerradoensis]